MQVFNQFSSPALIVKFVRRLRQIMFFSLVSYFLVFGIPHFGPDKRCGAEQKTA